ncbi:MAG: CpsD/CapB family tyrosine-protein kinase [Clostridiales bacterium]
MNKMLITHTDLESEASRFFRKLKTNVELLINNNNFKSFLIAGLKEKEGKSFVISNLAVLFAKTFEKTVLIDTNFKAPEIHNYFGINNANGLINYIERPEEIMNCIKKVDDIKNLDIITAGNLEDEKDQLIYANKIKNIVEQLYKKYELVLIDSPAIKNESEVKLISSFCDATILVVASGKVNYKEYEKTIAEIEEAGGNVSGVVLNYLKK